MIERVRGQLERTRLGDFLRVRDDLQRDGGLTAEDAALSTDKQLRLATDKVVEQAQAIHALRQELEAVRAQLAATPPGPPTAPRRSPSARQPPDAAAGRKVDAKTLATEEANAAAALQAKLEEETTRARDAMRQRLHLRKRRRETMTAAKAHL